MTTYNTGNPLGSTAVKDLYDNAENFDAALNDPDADHWIDRLGQVRKSWSGMQRQFDGFMAGSAQSFSSFMSQSQDEFAALLISSGYVDIGEYAEGLEIESRNQIFRKDGELYRAGAALSLPYTTTGNWSAEGASFVSVGDAALRQELAQPDGSEKVGFLQVGAGSVARDTQGKLRDQVNTKDKGVLGDGSDESQKLVDAVAAGPETRFAPAIARISAVIRAGGKRLIFDPGFRAYSSPSTPDLAHDQVIPSVVLADSYGPFDYARFGRADPTILSYGDSNTAWVNESGRIGVGQGAWRSYLDAYLGRYVYFANGRVRGDGSPGQTSQYALTNFDLFMSTYQPQITILGWGTNDIASGVSREQYLANMALLIEKFQQAGVMVIVLGIPWHTTYADKVKAWDSSLAALCRIYGVDFVPVYTLFANAPATYFYADGVHYTHVANQILAKVLGDIIVRGYGIPKNDMRVFNVRSGSSADPYSWECEGVRSTAGRLISIVQTPDQYVRRLYPYALKIDAGQEVVFTGAGPFSAMFDWPDSAAASWTLNGVAYSPVTTGAVVKVNSTSARLDGSTGNIRVGASAGSIYLLATMAEFGFPVRTYTPTEIRNGAYVPNRRITIQSPGRSMDTVMSEVSGAVDIGYAPDVHIPNVGPVSTRTAITSAPTGFKFFQSDTEAFYYWDGSAWQSW